jgi:tRNA-binding EMAP/Myf-like protein
MQGNGVTTAGSQIQVSTATVRGVKSFGMICSAHDLGWMEEANGFAVELPQEMEPGDALEGSPPKVQSPCSFVTSLCRTSSCTHSILSK